jgi:hypothetical protein
MSTDLDDLTPADLRDLDDLRGLMTRTVAGAEPPVRRLADRARRDGGRLRRRRRAAVAVGGLAAAAAVAALVVPLAGGSGSTARDDGYAGSPSRAADAGKAFVAKPGYWDMPAAAMSERLADLLPNRVSLTSFEETSTDRAPGESTALVGELPGTLAGRTGPGNVEVMLSQLPGRAVLDASDPDDLNGDGNLDGCPPELSSTDFEVRSCSLQRDSSGRVVERELEVADRGVITREVMLVTHGGTIYVASANSTQRKWTAPPSASRNPLTLDQLAHIATSTTWTDWTPSGS